MTEPHPQLVPLLELHEISWEEFRKLGRPPQGVREKRAAIVTTLHKAGVTWANMCHITGLSNGAIQRLTEGKRCPAARQNRVDNARRVGRAGAGRAKPWLSNAMHERWQQGLFDFHRGRVRSPEECAKLRATFTKERRQWLSDVRKALWTTDEYRKRLVAFHRSPEERARRSRAQSKRMAEDPITWTRGRGRYVDSAKHRGTHRFWVRSSYEAAAVMLLDADDTVCAFTYERRFTEANGHEIKPDFIVEFTDGRPPLLLEVKAAWTQQLPADHPVQTRLRRAQNAAVGHGMSFDIWTEKTEKMADAIANAM